uniref:Ig-like domain-containing protein n=1 Tax=Stegastes partitus TaxID=144197 RepID=A0A3B5ANL0_9TELE
GRVFSAFFPPIGQDWNITVKDKNEVEPGSDVTILCKFTVPPEENTTDIKVVWKTSGRHNCTDKDNNLDAFVLHWNDECVDDKYRHRTSLVGNAAEGNCSLRILDIRENVPKIYMRVFTKNKGFKYGFITKIEQEIFDNLANF